MRLFVVALACALLLSGCDGTAIGREHAREYFIAHQTRLQSLVDQIELCRPWNGRLDRDTDFPCQHPEGTPEAVKNAMNAANAQWIRVNYRSQEADLPIASINIAMHSTGFAFGGVIESFIYETNPAPLAQYERTDDGIATIEKTPMTGPPHHWYWWRIDR
jgi:hypothetical protein